MDRAQIQRELQAALGAQYALERELGHGGMATVYLARDHRHRRQVAVKVLHPELSAALGAERFLREIEVTASLQHPHILPLFDSGTAGELLYYVMPFIEGETLRARLQRESQLPVDVAVRLAREVADALSYAHARGVVHPPLQRRPQPDIDERSLVGPILKQPAGGTTGGAMQEFDVIGAQAGE